LKCDYCGREEALPFICNYCGGVFCSDHRLPEAHQCKGDLTQKRTIIAPPQTTFSWQEPAMTPEPAPPAFRQGKVFSGVEIRDIIIAWLALGLAFSFVLAGGGFRLLATSFSIGGVLVYLGISLITVGAGFVFHELSHKFVAQRYGYWAEFRMWPMGLVLALVTSLIGIVFAAPGATYISGTNISQGENGKISLAGPLTNVAIAALFSPFLLSGNEILSAVGFYGVWINVWLALFNMLPIGPLDGSKVFRWSLPIWLLVFIPLLIAFFFLYF
jgi:Zn-dependent protease